MRPFQIIVQCLLGLFRTQSYIEFNSQAQDFLEPPENDSVRF